MGELSRLKTVSMIAFLVVVWGISWPIYKVALLYTPPILFAGMRTLLGGLLLVLIFWTKRKQMDWKKNWPVYFIASIFNIMMFYGLQSVGLIYMPSGLFSVIVYFQPVLVGVLAWLWLGEAMTSLKIIGLITGFFGVTAVSSDGFSGQIAFLGIVLALLTAIGWALGTVYVKKSSNTVDFIWLAALQSVIGGIVLTSIGFATEQWSAIVWNFHYTFALLFGITFGISASWIVFFKLVHSGEASTVSSYTYLVPVVAVLGGTLFLKEPFTIALLIGLLLIALSIYLVNYKPKAKLKIGKTGETN